MSLNLRDRLTVEEQKLEDSYGWIDSSGYIHFYDGEIIDFRSKTRITNKLNLNEYSTINISDNTRFPLNFQGYPIIESIIFPAVTISGSFFNSGIRYTEPQGIYDERTS